jgi:hypothetical protein
MDRNFQGLQSTVVVQASNVWHSGSNHRRTGRTPACGAGVLTCYLLLVACCLLLVNPRISMNVMFIASDSAGQIVNDLGAAWQTAGRQNPDGNPTRQE